MFSKSFLCRATTLALIASATLLGSATALAQQRQLDIQWSPRAGPPTAFAVELNQRADGRLAGAIVPMARDVQIKGQRSALRATADATGLLMSFRTLWQQPGRQGLPIPRGQLSVQVDAPSPRPAGGGGGDIVVLDIVDEATRQASPAGGGGGGGDILVFDIIDSATSAATRIRIDARPEQQLVGSPAHWQWFNRPGPGEPLIATVPALSPGQVLNEVLEIRDALAPAALPMKIGLRFQF